MPPDVEEHERTLEALVRAEQSLAAERKARLEAEAMLDGLRKMASARSVEQIDAEILSALRGMFECEHAVVLVEGTDGEFVVRATTTSIFAQTRWQPGALFRRVLGGQPVAVFDVTKIPEWSAQSDAVRALASSALHVSLTTSRRKALLVMTHGSRNAFSPRHVELARRFMTVVGPLLDGIESKEIDQLRATAEARAVVLEQERATLEVQLETIRRQQAQIERLVAPTIPLWPGILLVPLVGSFEEDKACSAAARILEAVSRDRASEVLLDLTGVDRVDEELATRIQAIVHAVRIMGGRCRLSGIPPRMAQHLAEIGVDVARIRVSGTLGHAFGEALSSLGYIVRRG